MAITGYAQAEAILAAQKARRAKKEAEPVVVVEAETKVETKTEGKGK